jgi:hypothetical protein
MGTIRHANLRAVYPEDLWHDAVKYNAMAVEALMWLLEWVRRS